MAFNYSRFSFEKKGRVLQRIFQCLPGAISWTILITMILLSFFRPVVAAVLIIAFDLYWILKLLYMTVLVWLAYGRLSVESKTDWMVRANKLNSLGRYLEELQKTSVPRGFKNWFSHTIHKKEIEMFKNTGSATPLLDEIYHLVIYPMIKESRAIVEPSIQSVVASRFPPGRILAVLAVEDRADQQVKQDALDIQKKYKDLFFDFLVVFHPDQTPGEARVKGANATFAAKKAVDWLQKKHVPLEHVLVSCFDADTVVPTDYFACLTYHFMVCPNRHRASYQPIPMYHNNIWQVPGFARVLSTASSLFQLVESTDPEKLVTFSSHSMSLKALVEIGYWPIDMISDDSGVYWKALMHYDGNYRAIPIFTTLSMHMPEAGSVWQTAKNAYKQQRRWAWGVENFPIVMRGFLQNSTIPLHLKIRHGFKLLEGHVSWATWAFLLTVVGWLPALFAGRQFSDTVLYYSAPRITATIFNLSSLSIITSVILSLLLLPKETVKKTLWKKAGFALEWLMVPLIYVFFSALPALDAQTRLMFGRYMEFWITQKESK